MNIKEKFGIEIKKILKNKKMSAAEFSKISEIDRSIMQRWEKGELFPSYKNIEKLEKAGFQINIKITEIKK